MRLNPAFSKHVSFSNVKVPGLHSMVASFTCERSKHSCRSFISSEIRWLFISEGVPPPKKRVSTGLLRKGSGKGISWPIQSEKIERRDSGHSLPTFRTLRKASWGMSTRPIDFMRFLPSFCLASSFRFRETSPP